MIENSRPTEPGYYWWKSYPDYKWEPVRIKKNKSGALVIYWLNQRGFSFIESEGGIWGDKIDEPK